MKKTFPVLALALLLGGVCSAKDTVQVSVIATSGSQPIITVQGNPYSKGTFAVGEIQLLYTIIGYHFPTESFAGFNIGLKTAAESGKETDYSKLSLNLSQIGSENVLLSPSPASFSPNATGWSGASTITVGISPSVTAKDGAVLVGNLKIDSSPNGELGTTTSIQVKVKLVYPTSCLRVFNFITDEKFESTVNATQVIVSGGAKSKVTSSNPGQFSDNTLVVNTCSAPQNFSLGTQLDTAFQTSPNDNPGNAVFTFLKEGYTDPEEFNVAAFGKGTPQGESLCLTDITVPAGESFLETIHMAITRGMSPEKLPAGGVFSFVSSLYAGSGCSGALNSLAIENPAQATLSFTLSK